MFVVTTPTLAFELICQYKIKTNWDRLDNVYFCDVANNVSFIRPCDEVTNITGFQVKTRSNADVRGIRAEYKDIPYFPQGLGKYYDVGKFIFIRIIYGTLKEIHQKDLAPFKQLKIFTIHSNEIEVIERDLFRFNPLLEVINIGHNKIKFVDGNVFGHLNQLNTLWIDDCACISDYADERADLNKVNMKRLIRAIEKLCGSPQELGDDGVQNMLNEKHLGASM